MSTFTSGAKLFYGLSVYGAATKAQSRTGLTVGPEQTEIPITGNRPGYCVSAAMGSGAEFTLDPLTGEAATSDTPSHASHQAEILLNPGNNQTVTIDGTVYTFKDTPTDPHHVQTEATKEAALTNLIAAIVATHTTVDAEAASSVLIYMTAKTAGTAGNSITLAKSSDSTWTGFTGTFAGGANGVTIGANEGDGTDWEGVELPELEDGTGILILVTGAPTDRVLITDSGDYSLPIRPFSTDKPGLGLILSSALEIDTALTIAATAGNPSVEIIFIGTPAS